MPGPADMDIPPDGDLNPESLLPNLNIDQTDQSQVRGEHQAFPAFWASVTPTLSSFCPWTTLATLHWPIAMLMQNQNLLDFSDVDAWFEWALRPRG